MALNTKAVLAFVAAHESEAVKEDLQYWLTTHMYLTGLYYGMMTTVSECGGRGGTSAREERWRGRGRDEKEKSRGRPSPLDAGTANSMRRRATRALWIARIPTPCLYNKKRSLKGRPFFRPACLSLILCHSAS
jgi:hypothetical protein